MMLLETLTCGLCKPPLQICHCCCLPHMRIIVAACHFQRSGHLLVPTSKQAAETRINFVVCTGSN